MSSNCIERPDASKQIEIEIKLNRFFQLSETRLVYPFRHGVLHFINRHPVTQEYIDYTPQDGPKGTYILLAHLDWDGRAYDRIEKNIGCMKSLNRVFKKMLAEVG